ncbi:MAG: tetraprenyl-beta-curcumene synthase family protein [Firmicutes bacterium]|nr:tetraprenyl-beta-curcumene synthase family protein [Bacillota bacterium]
MSSIVERSKDHAIILPFVLRVFPQVEKELAAWRRRAATIPNAELRKQALASIETKRFHCQGGSIYALYTPEKSEELIRFIVAVQTISDYLDNLCDRVAGTSEKSFRTLHNAILAAVNLAEPFQNWYCDYPYHDDGGYLDQLVQVSRQALITMPGYQDICAKMISLLQLYTDLQVYKHIPEQDRQEMLIHWSDQHQDVAPDVYWWEFSAACGSTLAVFFLAAMAARGPVKDEEIEESLSCYFPWLCGLHILLDYYIDLDEDQEHHDLNFVAFYPSLLVAERGLHRFMSEAMKRIADLPRPIFHRTVIVGMLALYLSDPKASLSGRSKISQQLLRYGGTEAIWLHRVCLLLRNRGKI